MVAEALTLFALQKKKESDDPDKQEDTSMLLSVTMLIALASASLAYTANRHNAQPWAMAFVGFTFPYIYLSQAAVRAFCGDYT
jgi:hypothetical protein